MNPATLHISNELWRRQCFTKALGHMSTMNKKHRLVSDIERYRPTLPIELGLRHSSPLFVSSLDHVPLLISGSLDHVSPLITSLLRQMHEAFDICK